MKKAVYSQENGMFVSFVREDIATEDPSVLVAEEEFEYLTNMHYYDGSTWQVFPEKPEGDYYVQDLTNKLWVADPELKARLTKVEKHKARADKIKAGFSYEGLTYQIDSESRGNIAGKALEIQLDPSIEEVRWISNTKDATGNDIIHTFTKDEFIEFAKQTARHYEAIMLNS